MTERRFDDGFWDDPFVQSLPSEAKYLFVYLWTNKHCSAAGLYKITSRTIAFETGLKEDTIPALLDLLDEKVTWLQDKDLVWVKNFVNRQSQSQKYLVSVSKSMKSITHKPIVEEMIGYNQQRYSLSIPNPYDTDRNPIGTISASSSASDSDKKGGGEDTDEELAVIAQEYEANIGILTPSIAERLRSIRRTYPEGWFKRAADEACRYNKRNLAYIERILERWSVEGIDAVSTGKSKKEAPGPVHHTYRSD